MKPNYLQKNDTIYLVAPSFGCTTTPYKERMEQAIIEFKKKGLEVIEGENIFKADGIASSNTPEKRAKEIGFNSIKFKNKADRLLLPWYAKNSVFVRKGGGFVFKNYQLFNKVVRYNKSIDIPLFYNNLDTWSLKDVYEERFNRQMKFLKEKFIPLIRQTDEICDVGCASGDFTFEMAKYCKAIDGYEMSQKMVDFANTYAKENNISNAKFYQGICENINYQKSYDRIALMGVLTYIMHDDKAEFAVKNIYNALKPGGYLIYKDNSNETENNFYFLHLILFQFCRFYR